MIVKRKVSPTHIKLQRVDFLIKSLKIIIFFLIINLFILLGNFFFKIIDYLSFSIRSYNGLLIGEGAICIVISCITVSIRPGQNTGIDNYEPQNRSTFLKIDFSKFISPLKGTVIDRILSREIVIRKNNLYVIVILVTGIILLVLSAVVDVLFVSKRLL